MQMYCTCDSNERAEDLLLAVATTIDVVRKGFHPLHILVADDIADSADALACLLRIDGHSVSVALGGAQALALSAAVHPNVAVLDIGMPDIDGYRVASSIRQFEWGHAVHLIAFTGWNDTHSRRRAAAAGFDMYVVKPIDPLSLLKQINELEAKLR